MSELILEAGKYYEDREGNVIDAPLQKTDRKIFPYESTINGALRSWRTNGKYLGEDRTGVQDLVKLVEEEPLNSRLLKRDPPTGVADAAGTVIERAHTYIDINSEETPVEKLREEDVLTDEVMRASEPKEIELVAGQWYKVVELEKPALYAGKMKGYDLWISQPAVTEAATEVRQNLNPIKHLPECWSFDYKEKSTQEEVLDDLGVTVFNQSGQEMIRFARGTHSLHVYAEFNPQVLRAIANYIEYLEGGEK